METIAGLQYALKNATMGECVSHLVLVNALLIGLDTHVSSLYVDKVYLSHSSLRVMNCFVGINSRHAIICSGAKRLSLSIAYKRPRKHT